MVGGRTEWESEGRERGRKRVRRVRRMEGGREG